MSATPNALCMIGWSGMEIPNVSKLSSSTWAGGIGRVSRKLNRFEDADAAYAIGRQLADAAGDLRGVLLSRAGRAIALQGRGNLADAERVLQEVVAEARAGGYRDVEAGVEHALATTLLLRGQVADGIVHLWHAFETYD